MYHAGGKCIFVPFSLSLKFYAGRPLFNLFLQNVVAIIVVSVGIDQLVLLTNIVKRTNLRLIQDDVFFFIHSN